MPFLEEVLGFLLGPVVRVLLIATLTFTIVLIIIFCALFGHLLLVEEVRDEYRKYGFVLAAEAVVRGLVFYFITLVVGLSLVNFFIFGLVKSWKM